MAFRAIGDLAVEVLVNAKAARATQVAQELGGSPEAKRPDAPFVGNMGMGKVAEPGGPAKLTNREDHPSSAGRRSGRPVLMLVEGNRERRTANAANEARSPRAAVRLSLVLVDGGRHASTG